MLFKFTVKINKDKTKKNITKNDTEIIVPKM